MNQQDNEFDVILTVDSLEQDDLALMVPVSVTSEKGNQYKLLKLGEAQALQLVSRINSAVESARKYRRYH